MEARKAAGYKTARAFADAHKIPQATYALHESGKRGLSRPFSAEDRRETLVVYADKLGVRAAWLRDGDEPMKAPSSTLAKPEGDASSVDNPQRLVEAETKGRVSLVRESVDLNEDPVTLKILGHVKAGLEGFFLDQGEVQGMAPRPPILNGVKTAFAVRVRDDSMYPAYEPDDLVFVNPALPILPDKNVIIELIDGQAFIKRLVRRTEKAIICKQWNPPQEIRYDPKKVKAIYRIVRPT